MASLGRKPSPPSVEEACITSGVHELLVPRAAGLHLHVVLLVLGVSNRCRVLASSIIADSSLSPPFFTSPHLHSFYSYSSSNPAIATTSRSSMLFVGLEALLSLQAWPPARDPSRHQSCQWRSLPSSASAGLQNLSP